MAKAQRKAKNKLAIVGRGFGREKTLLIAVPLLSGGMAPNGLSVERIKGGYQVNMRGDYGGGRFGIATLQVTKSDIAVDFSAGGGTFAADALNQAISSLTVDGPPCGNPDALVVGEPATGESAAGELLDQHAEVIHRERQIVQFRD